MEHYVTFEAFGNVGDFIGGIGVVITLAYLALQIRQNSKSVKAASAQAVLGAITQSIASMASSSAASRVAVLGQTDFDQLSEDEQLQFAMWILGWFRVFEQAHHQFATGVLDPVQWKGHGAQIESTMQSPVVRRWWAVRRVLFDPDFRRFIDGLPAESSLPGLPNIIAALRGENSADTAGSGREN
jgi:hypothetical protein